jgi:hypothetical protein
MDRLCVPRAVDVADPQPELFALGDELDLASAIVGGRRQVLVPARGGCQVVRVERELEPAFDIASTLAFARVGPCSSERDQRLRADLVRCESLGLASAARPASIASS